MESLKVREFFSAKKRRAGSGIDWQAKKRAWVAAINRLYDTITKEYLAESIKAGDVKVSYAKKTITEEFVGNYEVRELVLRVGDEKVVFSPKGCNIIGATGRMDLIGERGRQTIVRQPGDRWGIVASRLPVLKIVRFEADSLVEALREVMRP